MSHKSLNVTWHDHLQHLSGLFHDLYENKKLVDVTLYCKEGSLKAHKIVLSSCSPYFAKIFQEIDSQSPVIILKGISFNEMHLLLEFMYKGSINILENELDSLIQAGSYLEIKGMDVKNIPSSLKNSCTVKRAATEAAGGINEITKKIKEEQKEIQTATITPMKETTQQMDKEEPIEAKEQTTDSTTSVPNESTTSTSGSTPTLHTRETRFKGQKRVDVTMLSKKFKFYDDDIPCSPKQSKKNENKGKNNTDEMPFISRVKGQKSNSPLTIKKDKQEEKNKERNFKLGNDDMHDSNFSRDKGKLNITFSMKKNQEKQGKNKQDHSENSNSSMAENTLSKIIIKDVYSTEEMQTSTPIRSSEKSKQKIAKKDNPETENDKEYINITPDVIMNDSDEEMQGTPENSDEYDYDDTNGNDDDDPDESDMLTVNYLECSQCKKTLKTEQEFKDHMKVHGGKPYKCDYCDSYFQRMSHLIRHRRTHTGEKPFSCRECGKCFSRQDKLKQHIRLHDENEYKPPAHLRKKYELPLPSDVKRRGRPKKNIFPVLETPKEKRSRGEHVENYDITNLPFGDFSYLTSSLPDFSDLTIIPVSYLSKSATEEVPISPAVSTKQEKVEPEEENKSQETESQPTNEEEEPEEKKQQEQEATKVTEPKTEVNENLSIIKLDEKKASVTSNNEITIINLNPEINEAQSFQKIPLSDSVKHLGECTIEAVSK